MNNFSELKLNVGVLCQRSQDTDYLDKIGVWLNLSQDFLYQSYDYFIELGGIYTFTSVDGRAVYPMPNDMDKPFKVFDFTNDSKLDAHSEPDYVQNNVSAVADSNEGIPCAYRIYGVQGVTGNWGTSGSVVKVKSSSSSDNNGIVVRIGGYIDSAKLIYAYENITIDTTDATSYTAGSTTFYEICEVSKSADTTGYISIADNAETVMGYISPTDRVVRNKVMRLGPIPDASTYSMRVYYKKRIRKMISDYDYPFIECDNYLILDAWGWALSQEKETMERAVTVWAKAKQAFDLILLNAAGALGTDQQHKISSEWAKAHRISA